MNNKVPRFVFPEDFVPANEGGVRRISAYSSGSGWYLEVFRDVGTDSPEFYLVTVAVHESSFEVVAAAGHSLFVEMEDHFNDYKVMNDRFIEMILKYLESNHIQELMQRTFNHIECTFIESIRERLGVL